MKKRFLAAIAAVLGLVVASDSHAATTILYATDFNSNAVGHTGNFATSADYNDGAIIGQDGWAITGTSIVSPILVANTATDGNVALTTTGQDVNRQFTPTVSSGSVFLSADINVSAAGAGTTGDYFIHLDDGTTTNFFDRVFTKASGAGYVMAVSTSSGTTPTFGTTVLSFGTVYHIVAEYDVVSGLANDTTELYVNPTDPIIGGDNLYVAGTTQGTDITGSFAGVNLRQGTTNNAPAVVVDNIIVATVPPAPEPASLSLIGLAVIGLVGGRRRRAF